MNSNSLTAKFQLTFGMLEVDIEELQAVRSAVLAYLQEPNNAFEQNYAQFRDQFRSELEQADCIVGMDGVARLDAWILERREDGGGLRLVRHSARAAVMYQYYADLVREHDREWYVVDFGDRRVTASR